jgi:hypothetical protein
MSTPTPTSYCMCPPREQQMMFARDGGKHCANCDKGMRPPNREERRAIAKRSRKFSKVAPWNGAP